MKPGFKIRIELPDGTLIERVPKFISYGNLQMMKIKYKNDEYLVGDGDEYIRGDYNRVFELGKKLSIKDMV